MPTVCFFSHDQLRATTATSAADGIIVGHGGLKDPADHLTGDDADVMTKAVDLGLACLRI